MKMIGEATVKKTAGQDWAGRKTAERGMTEKEGTGNITGKNNRSSCHKEKNGRG